MCGIVGMAGDLEYKDKDVFNAMLFFCQLRGQDSTGVFSVPKDSAQASIIKTIGTPDYLFAKSTFDRLSMYQSRVLIGHCRKATIGAINQHTAHPFNYGKITGVHNGTLRNWRDLPGDSESIDSQTLFENFDRVGVRETIEAVDGAYGLIWWNSEDETLNVLRNNERPLHYAFSEDFKKILWASEAWMITIAADRAGFKLADLTPKESTYARTLPVELDRWWKLKIARRGEKDAITFLKSEAGDTEELKGGVKKATYSAPFSYANQWRRQGPHSTVSDPLDDNLDDVASADQKKLPGLQAPATTASADASANTSSASSSSFEKTSTSNASASLPRRTTLSLVQTNKSSGDGKSFVIGHDGLILDEAEWKALVANECYFCQRKVKFEEALETVGEWINDSEFICKGCLVEPSINPLVSSSN